MKTNGQGVAPQTASENEWIRDFIAMAVHDLREPLRSIRLGAQLLTGDGAGAEDDDSEAARGARYVEDGLNRMEGLIRDLSEFCYAAVDDLHLHETDAESVLTEVQKEFFSELSTGGALLTHDPLPTIVTDAVALAAVFRALIANACKFRSERPLRIHVGVAREAPEWVFSVQDNGQGFDPVYKERIFRHFERLHGKRYPGSGLGLPLARTVVEQLGGKIWAESSAGEGTTLRFTLPG